MRPPVQQHPSGRRATSSSWRKWFRRILIGSSVTLLLIALAIAGAIAYAWNTMSLPPDIPLSQTTIVSDLNGNRLASFNAGENRVKVTLDEVPPVVRQAVIDTEDHNFYRHRGVDPRGTARALLSDFRNKATVQGGSTLTQQYVKTVYVGRERTAGRKFREAILAMKLERKYSKNEILERYLNAVYFGRSAYGIETASRSYFGKDVQQITLREASYLAGLLRAPEAADVYADPVTATQRRDRTLGSMVRFGTITPEQMAAVQAQPLQSYVIKKTAIDPQVVMADKGTQYFIEYVRQILVKTYGEQVVESGGLRVKTTLDPDLQAKAYDAVYGFLKRGEPAGALVTVDNNGAIKAMVGGRSYKESQVNLALGREGGGTGRQAGSTFKAFALAAAIENGISVRDTFPGPAKITLTQPNGLPWQVSNFGNESFGQLDLIDATAHSVNTVYAQLALKEGAQKIVDMAKKAGITAPLDANPALVLGTDSVSPLDMADAYMTFGLRGQHVTTSPILEVRDGDGQILEKAQPQRTQVMSQNTADTVNYALQQVVQRGTGTAASIGRPLAGKTGTTSDNGDAWFVGYTPTLTTAVWMGYPEGGQRKMNSVRGIEVTGGTFPAQMFSTFMRGATKDVPDGGFPMPSDWGTPTTTERQQPPTSFGEQHSRRAPSPPVNTTEAPVTSDGGDVLGGLSQGDRRNGRTTTTANPFSDRFNSQFVGPNRQ